MDILYDHQMFAIQKFGGISRIFIELMRELSPNSDCSIHWHRGIKTDGYDISEYCDQLTRYWVMPKLPFPTGKVINDTINKLSFQWFVRRFGRQYDIYHPTYYDADLVEIVKPKKLVITIHDMIPEKFLSGQAKFQPLIKNKQQLVEQSDLIFVASENTRNDLVDLLGVNPEKTKVTYWASRIQDANECELPKDCRSQPYFLYVGTRSKYKNFEIVLKAFAASPKLRDNFKLVCFGGSCDFLESEFKVMEEHNMRQNFIYLRGDDTLLKTLYCNAQALIYTSRYEGFGLPPLEAMECQCPVICCLTSSLPEVVGDAASLFEPDSVDGLVNAMEIVVEDSEHRASMIEKGRQRAKLFTWQKTAQRTLDGYRSISS
ncbi:glycosyltransferase family 1 protein [Moorena sp. SIO3I6]|uniref:glycosyltransferase family 4 protein n=1 Tax=Moorena sp. SIO3I6 TaxID=2607831 RepID=UPI0013F8912B|nr:glycosyltransferase family 1 protein [Moorena sp. SIO3I6]NEP23821.1 glycosyltransferase family 4 protein [Moorena sp. SIO3I6]